METKGCKMGFFNRRLFDMDDRKQFQADWSKKSDAEKVEWANEKVRQMCQDPFSAEALDARCQKWMSMTPEEKEAFLDGHRNRMRHCVGRHHRHGCSDPKDQGCNS